MALMSIYFLRTPERPRPPNLSRLQKKNLMLVTTHLYIPDKFLALCMNVLYVTLFLEFYFLFLGKN